MNKVWKVFWYRPSRFSINFGDEITAVLFEHYNLNAKRVRYNEAELFSTGTILGWQKINKAIILGSGMDSHAKYRPEAKVGGGVVFYGLRGKNTAKLVGVAPKNITLGDPGLMMARVVKKPAAKYRIGVVPNSVDWAAAKKLYGKLPVKMINPSRTLFMGAKRQTRKVVKEIASCEMILSSSLHGNVIADAYGIPNAHITLGKKVSEEKFRDYFSIYSNERYNSENGEELKTVEEMESFVERAYKPVKPKEMERIIDNLEGMLHKVKQL
ncbi:polysaccharide pyruvyl transferase family protein [Candidatus Saccharibacteria bacterium]|nr:polysaccharide pyruvyl transferase family protein [Candidatus Saccharibacteria bacterium]